MPVHEGIGQDALLKLGRHEAMPMNARGRNRLARQTPEVIAEMERAFAIWSRAGTHAGGPWLFGCFCAADIMFSPVADREQRGSAVLRRTKQLPW